MANNNNNRSVNNNNNNNGNRNSNRNSNGAGNNSSKKSKAGKIIKIVIIVVVVLLLIYFGYKIYSDYSSTMSSSPYLVSNLIEGSTSKLIEGSSIPASQDSRFGIEFTYSTWLYVKDSNFYTQSCSDSDSGFKCIFYKGSEDYSVSNNKTHYPLLQSPGVWLYPNENKLNINMNTYENPREQCDVGNLPVNKWFHLIISLIGNSLDVYINCKLKKRCKLRGVPKINYGALHINYFGGFQGYMSKFRYFNYAIQPYQIDQICKEGPGSLADLSTDLDTSQTHLARDYWTTTGFPMANGFP